MKASNLRGYICLNIDYFVNQVTLIMKLSQNDFRLENETIWPFTSFVYDPYYHRVCCVSSGRNWAGLKI